MASLPGGERGGQPSRNVRFLVTFASVWSRDGTYTPTTSRGPVSVSTVTAATRCGR
ncbi:hypothetical protein [Streptomyces sp. NPDC001758]